MQQPLSKPLKIGLQTWGSNGDVRPLIALADGLQRAGHTVTLIVSSIDNRSYADTCRELDIAYQQIPAHIEFDMQGFAQRTFEVNTLKWLIELLENCFFPYEREIYQAAQKLVTEHDLVIGHHFLYPLKLAAKIQQRPYISVTMCHGAVPTRLHPPFKFPGLGRLFNRWQWRLLDLTFDLALKKRLSHLWLAEGLPPVKHVVADLITSDLLNLVVVDPFLCPYKDEWQPLHQACGFLNLPTNAEPFQISLVLQSFLDAGDKPVYMTFGSLQQAVPDWSMDLFINAAKLAGCRAIIQTSSPRFPAESQQGPLFFIGRHPHQPIFRQCAAVVHHGGAGTSHSAALSGCPSVVVPFMDEQFFWGCQLQIAGIAAAPLYAKNATAEKLAERLVMVLSSAEMAKQAQQAALSVSPTQGVVNAVALIEAIIGGLAYLHLLGRGCNDLGMDIYTS
ncbi:MAG: glycosyltransferase family 1 protein [Methylococcaceae bacterium]|nr:glycosyltransferase family 1 protein [Methylococcaceae bacterium]